MTTRNTKPIKYKYKDLFRKWDFSEIKLSVAFAEATFTPCEDNQTAAWDLYVELLTRITTQELPDEYGDEATALSSIYGLFEITSGC